MSKKTERITFRTTDECNNHLKDIHKRYDLPISDIVHRMVQYFAKSGDAGDTGEKLLYFVNKKHSGYGGDGKK